MEHVNKGIVLFRRRFTEIKWTARQLIFIVVVGLLLVISAFSGVRYLIDRTNYAVGQRAYQQADCVAAVQSFDQIIRGSWIFDLGGFLPRVEAKKAECLLFQAAVEKQQAQDFSAALVAYLAFVAKYGDSDLVSWARQRIARFIEAGPAALADLDFCGQLDTLLARDLFPQPATYLPSFYMACGLVYDEAENWQRSYGLYRALLSKFPDHLLTPAAADALLGNPQACVEVDDLKESANLRAHPDFGPRLYYKCGQVYDRLEDWPSSLELYQALLSEYPDHLLALAAADALVENPQACLEVDTLKQDADLRARPDFVPQLYYECGHVFEAQNSPSQAFEVYHSFLIEYPDHALAAVVEAALLANFTACVQHETLANSALAARPEFLPTLYYQCGQSYQASEAWRRAIQMYDLFLLNFADHPRAEEVEQDLVAAIVAAAQETSAGEIPPPERSGRVAPDTTEIIIQNHSPERLRIVFSGPEIRVEELAACSTCIVYPEIGPEVCPAEGPLGRYELLPGHYDVVVEASSDQDTTPWTGSWTLLSGDEYSSCFLIVSNWFP